MGQIIAVVQTKGGAGKSTLAVQIALTLVQRGFNVLVIDGDEQGTTEQALINRTAVSEKPAVAFEAHITGAALAKAIRARAHEFDYVVIDAGGRDTEPLRAAIRVATKLVAPFVPSEPDVWAMQQLVAIIRSENTRRAKPVPAFGVVNLADPGDSADNRDCAAMIREAKQFRLLDGQIVRRKAVRRAFGLGLAVAEYKPLDPIAIAEIEALVTNIQ